MPEQHPNSLLPSQDEIRQILAQTLNVNPFKYPVTVLRIEFACRVARYFDKLNNELNTSAKQMDDKFQAAIDEFTKKIDGTIGGGK